MSETAPDSTERIRAQAAAEERAAILQIIERYARQLFHGHGAGGAQVLQQIIDEIGRRDEAETAQQP
ncbi:MAG: hypothetical protein KY467_09370 [Gemmatimonadetes bacterium]|nr:hypothetical protein [Gemmatimonadota bacterium]